MIIISLFSYTSARAVGSDSTDLLIADMIVQIEATEAMNAMYDFNFKEAHKQYNWLRQKYPDSPTRYTLSHIQVMAREDVSRFSKYGVIAQSTPLWARHDAEGVHLSPKINSIDIISSIA